MTLPEQMAKAAYEKREPGMVWSALSEASREAMTEDMEVGLDVLTLSGLKFLTRYREQIHNF